MNNKQRVKNDLIIAYLHLVMGRTIESVTQEDLDKTCLAHATHELYNKHRVLNFENYGIAFLQKELDSDLLEIAFFAYSKPLLQDVSEMFEEAMDTVDFEEYDEFTDSDVQDIAYLIEEHHLPVFVMTATMDKVNMCYNSDSSLSKCSIGTKMKFDYFEDEDDEILEIDNEFGEDED